MSLRHEKITEIKRLYPGSGKTSLEAEASRADKTPIGIESKKDEGKATGNSFDPVRKASLDALSRRGDDPDRPKKASELYKGYVESTKHIRAIEKEIHELSESSGIDFVSDVQHRLQTVKGANHKAVWDAANGTFRKDEPLEENRASNKKLLEEYVINTKKREDFLVGYQKAMVVFQESVGKAAINIRPYFDLVCGLQQGVHDLTQKKREQSDQIGDLTRQWQEDRQKLNEQEKQLRIREQEEQNTKQNLKELMSPIFREGGDIQLLCEEAFTIKTMEQTLQSPPLADEFMQLLQQGGHALDPRSQTALAFSYASQYLEFTKSPDPTFNFIHAARAMHEVKQKKETILCSPDDVLFYRSGVNKQIKKIEAGTMQPQNTWEEEKERIQSKIESILATANLQEDGSAKWEEHQRYPHRREFVDLSSLSLSYQGQHLRSVETITSYKVDGIQQPYIPYMNMKLTTMDNQNYFSFSNGSSKNSAASEIITSVQPFVSGMQVEREWPLLGKQSGKDMTAAKTGKMYLTWHLSSRHRDAYHGRIHPAITRYACSLIEHLGRKSPKENITILDIAGGNGDLGERILKAIRKQFPDRRVTYRLVDYGQEDVDIAKERFQTLQTDRVDALAVSKDMLSYEFNAKSMKDDLALPKDGVDLVINSGGLLNNLVTDDHQMAIKFNKMYSDLMTTGGFGIYSGLTPLLVNSEHHKAIGLEICNLYDIAIPSGQMHVVRKPDKEA